MLVFKCTKAGCSKFCQNMSRRDVFKVEGVFRAGGGLCPTKFNNNKTTIFRNFPEHKYFILMWVWGVKVIQILKFAFLIIGGKPNFNELLIRIWTRFCSYAAAVDIQNRNQPFKIKIKVKVQNDNYNFPKSPKIVTNGRAVPWSVEFWSIMKMWSFKEKVP